MLAAWVVGLAALAGACTVETAPAPGTEVEAGAPTGTTTAPPPPPAPTTSGSVGLDAATPQPTDASNGAPDATTDAAPDAPTDAAPGGPTDAASGDGSADASDGGSTLVQGADGVLRGNIVVGGERTWDGSAALGSASCPAGAMTVGGCCRYFGGFTRGAAVPLELDLGTGAATIAGIAMSLGLPVAQPDGTLRFSRPTLLVATPMWRVAIEVGRAVGEPAQELDEATKFLDVVRPVSDSLRSVVVTWHPTTKAFSLRLDLTTFQGNASACASGILTYGRLSLSGR